ncbi:glutathione s-transferase [Colletotrichum sojae]|uniref:Glutathione s-transferase n=1 Tax=Colletotrichum sojae TaxID=2175907 RepID=A0A8H6IXT0_9PEZI|nr:glutathione s-transferase [Colletotrichum sojae]
MSTASHITFYDIATRPPVEESNCSPNPWKARMALNFKGVPYKTTWVAPADIEKVRKGLNVPPVRKFADGEDFYTLPVISDPSTGALVGDSFDIAGYLQKTYPDSGAGDLFPPQALDYDFEHPSILVPLSDCRESEHPAYAKFNVNMDAMFTAHVQLTTQGFPFDPATEEATKALFVHRASAYGIKSWADFALEGEARQTVMESFEQALGGPARLFREDPNGPFLLGTRASHADFIVGGWLRMFYVTLPESEWKEITSWHDGIFGKLHEALKVYAEVK